MQVCVPPRPTPLPPHPPPEEVNINGVGAKWEEGVQSDCPAQYPPPPPPTLVRLGESPTRAARRGECAARALKLFVKKHAHQNGAGSGGAAGVWEPASAAQCICLSICPHGAAERCDSASPTRCEGGGRVEHDGASTAKWVRSVAVILVWK